MVIVFPAKENGAAAVEVGWEVGEEDVDGGAVFTVGLGVVVAVGLDVGAGVGEGLGLQPSSSRVVRQKTVMIAHNILLFIAIPPKSPTHANLSLVNIALSKRVCQAEACCHDVHNPSK
jgi:hypothetical protein